MAYALAITVKITVGCNVRYNCRRYTSRADSKCPKHYCVKAGQTDLYEDATS